MSDAQLGYGVASGFLGRITEISLGIESWCISKYGCDLFGAAYCAVIAYGI